MLISAQVGWVIEFIYASGDNFGVFMWWEDLFRLWTPQPKPDLLAQHDLTAQGFLGNLLLSEETIVKIEKIVSSIDPDKVSAFMKMVETDDNGEVHIKIDLRVKK